MDFFDRDALRRELKSLTNRQRLIFVLLCADRQVPSLKRLTEIRPDLDANRVRSILDRLWDLAQAGSLGPHNDELTELVADCEASLPDWEEHAYNWQAQCTSAVSTVIYAICVARDGGLMDAVDAGMASLDSASLFARSEIGDSAEGLSADQVECLAAIQQEIQKQKNDVKRLKGARSLDFQLVESMRNENAEFVIGAAAN
jgi:uncharacterized protein YjaG (DUF416 family)